MEELNLFIDIVSNSKNVNNLPILSDIYQKLESLSIIGDCDYDIETDCMMDNWDGTKVILIDGSTIELIYGKNCILHSYDDFDKEYSYKIGDNLYICAGCLSIQVEHKDLCEIYYSSSLQYFLFPKRWNKNSVISWMRKSEKRQEEYYARKYIYQNYYDSYSNCDDIEDEDDEDYFSIEEFIPMHNQVNKIKEERKDTWQQEDCQNLYNIILNNVINPSSLTKDQLKQAKDMSISAILKNKEPDFERFVKRVEQDREKALKWKKRKTNKNQESHIK